MDYYNISNSGYIAALKQPNRFYKIKVEILDHWENTIGEIVKDLDTESMGEINVNYQQGARRTCSLSLINIDNKYDPNENSVFWIGRKFKIYIGITTEHHTYWWSQGVFITLSATSENKVTNIEGVDKFALFDGTLKTSMSELKRIVSSGSNIRSLIQETILIQMGNGKPIDPIEPHIDLVYNSKYTQAEISVESSSYISEIFTELAKSYSAEIYYDVNGYLNFRNIYSNSRVSGYVHLPHLWEYTTDKAFYCNPNVEYNFQVENAVTVYTNSSSLENVSYTAYNKNPQSPIRIDYGIRRLPSQEISYVACEKEDMRDRCRQYAEYLLLKNTLVGMSVSFESPIIPHLDVNETIGITDEFYGSDRQTFVIQSLTIPLGSGSMTVNACNIQYLPDGADLGRVSYVWEGSNG